MAEGSKESGETAGRGATTRGSRTRGHDTERHERGDRRGTRSRPGRYLISVAPPADSRILVNELGNEQDTRVIRTGPSYLIVETSPARAAALSAAPYLRVEPDQRLSTGNADALPDGGPAPAGELRTIQVLVSDDAGRPVEGAAVFLTGLGGPAIGYTRTDGHAELTMPIETAAGPRALSVRPARGCWPVIVDRPVLRTSEPVTAVCERIVSTFPDFPERALENWGARAMGFGTLPPTLRGNGVKIALISSGVAAGHPDLSGRIADGIDITSQDAKSWQEDPVGTGTHLAVLLLGRDDGSGVTGLVPEAELHVCKTAPGGHCGDLIEALDYCVTHQVDIALITQSVRWPSALLAERVARARAHGVAIIAAAGDDAGLVSFPAGLPGVLAVGAVGMLGTFPPDSGLAGRVTGPIGAGGFFAPYFTNRGPGIDCCGPGVAIVSGLPPASYGPLDGTAVAAAHVAGAGAMMLAHHPALRPRPGVRGDAGRPDRLLAMLLSACRPIPGIDPAVTGAGLPDAAVAVR